MPLEYHYLSLIMMGLILIRIFLKERKEKIKKTNAYITVVNIGILLVLNLITYSYSDQYQMFFRNLYSINTLFFIALFIFINVTLLIDIIKIKKGLDKC